jgi:hypothetical protein
MRLSASGEGSQSSTNLIRFLCGPLRIFAASALRLRLIAENSEIRREPQSSTSFCSGVLNSVAAFIQVHDQFLRDDACE